MSFWHVEALPLAQFPTHSAACAESEAAAQKSQPAHSLLPHGLFHMHHFAQLATEVCNAADGLGRPNITATVCTRLKEIMSTRADPWNTITGVLPTGFDINTRRPNARAENLGLS